MVPFPVHAALATLSAALLLNPSGPSSRDANRLQMAAQASGRPKECLAAAGATKRRHRITIWDRAREPRLQRYCDLLGRAFAKLEESPAAAREAARLADQVHPGRASPWVVIARAHVKLRDYQQAVDDFQRARALDPSSVEDPFAMHDLAVALRKAGQQQASLEAYRVLVPRLGLISSTDARVGVLLEAASLAMAQGPGGLGEATALLAEARSMPLSRHDADVMGMLALALDRAGREGEAASLLTQLSRLGFASSLEARDAQAFDYLAEPADAIALVALVVEHADPKRAALLWQRYIDRAANGPFVDHARGHLRPGVPRSGAKPPSRPGAP